MRALVGLLFTGCVIAKRDVVMPDDRETVALLTGGLVPPMNDIARHPWFAVRKAGERAWRVYEVPSNGVERDPFRGHTPYVDPMLHKVWRGAEAERAATCLEREAGPWMVRNKYPFYPGPNSNTFGAAMLRATAA